MKERPIIFSAPMVRAILDGRKTQTRRLVKNVGNDNNIVIKKRTKTRAGIRSHILDEVARCPYGKPDDRLWVRECFSDFAFAGTVGKDYWYWADGNPESGDWTKPKPSIHMPRAASRILLEITAVRVEKLWEISANDAEAEGLWRGKARRNLFWQNAAECRLIEGMSHDQVFGDLWRSIHGAESWNENPWIWVIEFKKVAA